MKIKSEYTILSECVEKGIDFGYIYAHKHDSDPPPDVIKREIYKSILTEISEYFLFDEQYDQHF